MHKSTKKTIQKNTKSKDFEHFCVFSVFFRKKYLTKCEQICDSLPNGRGNPTKQQPTANNSTPLNRAFFVRSIRTPNQNGLNCLFSMIACSGKPLQVGGVPLVAVFPPRYTLSPSRGKQSDNFRKQSTELSAMIYLFLGINRQFLADTSRTFKTLPKNRLAVRATSEQDARARIAPNWCILQSWAFQNPEEINRTFATSSNKGVIYA